MVFNRDEIFCSNEIYKICALEVVFCKIGAVNLKYLRKIWNSVLGYYSVPLIKMSWREQSLDLGCKFRVCRKAYKLNSPL